MKNLKILFFTILISLTFALSVGAEFVSEFVSSDDTYGMSFEIKENELIISGKIENNDIKRLVFKVDDFYILNVIPDTRFNAKYDLSDITTPKVSVMIALGTDESDAFTVVFDDKDVILEKVEDEWFFSLNDRILENNTLWQKGYISTKDIINSDQPEAVKMVTSNVISGITLDYEKARAIHKWVADNIYYDKDFASKIKTKTALTPLEVLTERVTVCEGYANLTVAMLHSAGIPAVMVEGYALGVGVLPSWDYLPENPEANHAWVEAFVAGEWITLDPTWDSKNMCENGKKTTIPAVMYRYFDVSPEMLTRDHMILYRPNTFGLDGVSSWAEEEVKAAHEENLTLPEQLTTLKENITREEFCNLVVNFLEVKLGKSVELIIEDKGLKIDENVFLDTKNENILIANALGIVFGRGNGLFDPEGMITRGEAAAMLTRTAKALGVTTPNSEKIDFVDSEEFPTWFVADIDFVSASKSKQGYNVMTGVGGGRFDPLGNYTKEQSLLTVHRLFNTY